MVVEIKSMQDFDEKLAQAGSKVVVIDFMASWCSPCKKVAPIFEEYANMYPNHVCYKVDVDECEDVAIEYNIQSIPTFILFRNKQLIDKFEGFDAEKLQKKIEKHQ